MLRSMLASDARFPRVTVSLGTNGRVVLHGSVAFDDDLRTLRTLVEQGHLPSQPLISVLVDSHPPTKALQRRPAGQSDGADNLPATLAADRAFPAAVAELGR